MTQLSVTRSTFEKFEAVQVDTGLLSLSLLPELGGKLNSLRDQRSGREWLWRHPRMGYRRVPHGASYIREADTGGWDECFPSVAPCDYPSQPWAGAHIQDHGELWSQSAELEVVEDEHQVRLRTRWHGVVLPYTFERTISLTAGSATLRMEYTLSSHADAPQQFIWSAHPLLAIEPGMSLLFPPSASFNVGSSTPRDLFVAQSGLRFPTGRGPMSSSPPKSSEPVAGSSADADSEPTGSGPSPSAESAAGLARTPTKSSEHVTRLSAAGDPMPPSAAGVIDFYNLRSASARIALKLWSDPLDEGYAALRARDGELRMRWDAALLPQLGLWLNLGAWAGDGGAPYYNLGLEPCIGAQDSLADAVQRNLFATLPPRGLRAWWLELELSTQHDTQY